VLLLHPQTTAWTLYNDVDREPLNELQKKFLAAIKELEQKHIDSQSEVAKVQSELNRLAERRRTE